MRVALSMIEGGDFKNAGSATSALKRLLKKINMDPADMRRAIIAAFEAEMNVVIHARRGSMRAIINSDEVEVEVRDEGPGIPDIELAMKEGYSTASPQARQLGYGAGLGLPNMKKNSNLFEISSTVGEGTRVSCTVFFKTQLSTEGAHNSIRVIQVKCRQCLFCVRVCATKALRVYAGKPEIIKDLCIDCGACIDTCNTGALTISETPNEMEVARNKVLLVPSPFLAQFSAVIKPNRVLGALRKLGFGEIYLTESWDNALRGAVIRYATEEAKQLPLVSPVCPVVINLITLRFQPLIASVAPFLSPIEAAKAQFGGQAAVFVASCPAQMTLLGGESPPKNVQIVIPSTVRRMVQPIVLDEVSSSEPGGVPRDAPADGFEQQGVLRVYGMSHVIAALEKMENGRLRDVRILEPYACECGCYGSPLLTEQPFLARYRACRDPVCQLTPATAVRRMLPLSARTGMRLSADVSNAIVKLAEVEDLTKILPGKDCGLCGAPSCDALAEDVVMGRASRKACPYVLDEMEATP